MTIPLVSTHQPSHIHIAERNLAFDTQCWVCRAIWVSVLNCPLLALKISYGTAPRQKDSSDAHFTPKVADFATPPGHNLYKNPQIFWLCIKKSIDNIIEVIELVNITKG